jgi:hypothetical protein
MRPVRSAISVSAQAAPLACAVHCMAMPLLAASFPMLGSGATEWAFFGAGALLSLAAGLEAARHHRRLLPLVAVSVAITAWALSIAGAARPLPEDATSVAACLALAAASLWGARLRHHARCQSCTCPAAHGEHHHH